MAIQTALDSISQNQGSPFGFKNRIINGGMVIDQRNAGASHTPTDGYNSVDRSRFALSQSSKITAQQNQGSVTPPPGFTNYIGITSSSSYSLTSSDYFLYQQRLEGYNVSDLDFGLTNAKFFTISFWVRSSLTGTFSGTVSNSAYDRNYTFTYTINSANTWEYKTITLQADTSGTWLKTNGIGLSINWSLGAGSNYTTSTLNTFQSTAGWKASGAVDLVATNAATWYITGVQLEVGKQATSFDYRPYGTELQLCQRYFEKSYNQTDVPGTATYDGSIIQRGTSQGGGYAGSYVPMIPKRTAPSVTFYRRDVANTTGSWQYGYSGGYSSNTVVAAEVGSAGFRINLIIPSNWAACEIIGHWTASAEL